MSELQLESPTSKEMATDTTESATQDDISALSGVNEKLLQGRALVLAFIGMMMSILLIALDQTIVATAVPVIASQFNALEDVTWIVGAYLLTQVAFMLTYGQALAVVPTKWVYLFAIVIFELGSLICGVAPSSTVLIFGRAFAGVGAGGIFVSCYSIIAEATRIEQRPFLYGAFGAIFAFASVVGPLVGGAFTDHVTWRWCFYINLPIGGLAFSAVAFVLKAQKPLRTNDRPAWRNFLGMDWIGSGLCLATVVCLVLPLQWGGNEHAWNSAVIIALFCVFGVLLAMFIGWEWHMGNHGILPLKLFTARSQVGCCIISFCTMINLMVFTYYLPLQYQAVEDHSATTSGIDILPVMLGVVITGMSTGAIIARIGRYWPFIFFGPMFSAVGAGLLYTTSENSTTGKLIGYQVLLGVGVGMTMQNSLVAVQANTNDPLMIPVATSLVSFTQFLGGIIGIAIAGTVFDIRLSSGLATYAPQVDADLVKSSVSAIYSDVSDALRPGVIYAYVKALDDVYLMGVPAAVLTSFGALLVRNIDLRSLQVPVTAAHAA